MYIHMYIVRYYLMVSAENAAAILADDDDNDNDVIQSASSSATVSIELAARPVGRMGGMQATYDGGSQYSQPFPEVAYNPLAVHSRSRRVSRELRHPARFA